MDMSTMMIQTSGLESIGFGALNLGGNSLPDADLGGLDFQSMLKNFLTGNGDAGMGNIIGSPNSEVSIADNLLNFNLQSNCLNDYLSKSASNVMDESLSGLSKANLWQMTMLSGKMQNSVGFPMADDETASIGELLNMVGSGGKEMLTGLEMLKNTGLAENLQNPAMETVISEIQQSLFGEDSGETDGLEVLQRAFLEHLMKKEKFGGELDRLQSKAMDAGYGKHSASELMQMAVDKYNQESKAMSDKIIKIQSEAIGMSYDEAYKLGTVQMVNGLTGVSEIMQNEAVTETTEELVGPTVHENGITGDLPRITQYPDSAQMVKENEASQNASNGILQNGALMQNGMAGLGIGPAPQNTAFQGNSADGLKIVAVNNSQVEAKTSDNEKTIESFELAGNLTNGNLTNGKLHESNGVQEAHTEEVFKGTQAKQISDNVLKTLKNGKSEFMMELNPAGLGKINVRLTWSGEKLAIDIACENPETRSTLLAQADSLARHLGMSNVQVEGVNVRTQSEGLNEQTVQRLDGNNFDMNANGQRDESQSGENKRPFRNNHSHSEKACDVEGLNEMSETYRMLKDEIGRLNYLA